MNSEDIHVEIYNLDEKSTCIGRNGTFEVKTVRLFSDGDGNVKLEFVSRDLSRVLNAGAMISEDDMDRLALAWLRARGGMKKHFSICVQEKEKLRRSLAAIIREAAAAIDPIDNGS